MGGGLAGHQVHGRVQERLDAGQHGVGTHPVSVRIAEIIGGVITNENRLDMIGFHVIDRRYIRTDWYHPTIV